MQLARVPAVLVLFAASTTCAQEWRALSPGVREGSACCYDPIRGVTVLFGGASPTSATVPGLEDTWEWNGTQWSQRQTTVAPSGRLGAVMAYDPVRGTCLLFGGWSSANLADTWEWDGVRWQQLHPTVAPTGGEQIGMATDFVRGRIVLARVATTFEWDGTNWHAIPSGAAYPGPGPLAWDPVRRRVAAFSGNTHWEWNGVAWSTVSVAVGMTPRSTRSDSTASLAFDTRRSRLMVFGGVAAGSFTNELWEWDGATWQQRTVPALLKGRCYHGGVFDDRRSRMVVIAGRSYPRSLADVWEWDGGQWTAAFVSPEPSTEQSMASDPATGRVLLLAENGTTYEWRDGRWTAFPPVPPVPSPYEGAMVFDTGRGRFVYWSGTSGSTPLAEVHEWAQGTWIRQSAAPPPARAWPAMAYDPVRARLVVFGGRGPTRLLDDTWEYDGVTWREVVPTTRPPYRDSAAMAFDPIRGRLLLYGGSTSFNATLGDMWEWSGTDWVQLTPPQSPGARKWFAMVTDPVRGTILLHGGANSSVASLRDTWEWTGTTWNRLVAGTTAIGARADLAHDGKRMLAFGGVRHIDPAAVSSATTSLLSRAPGRERAYGTGCSGSAPAATLLAANAPYAGNLAFGVAVANASASAPCVVAVSAAPDNLAWSGCTLLVRPPLVPLAASTSAAGVSRIPLPIPEHPAFVGSSVYAQAFVADPRGAVFGLVWTNGLEIAIGD